jgi:hypothetical protein
MPCPLTATTRDLWSICPRLARLTLCCFVLLAFSPLAFAGVFNVRDFGARGDKTTLDTAAIQAAIDACSKAGGGEVSFPPGDYLSGKFSLKSNITLKLEPGSTLWASDKPQDYSEVPKTEGNWYLIVAQDQENIAIAGDGKIEGVGKADLDRRSDPDGGPLPPHRFGIINFQNCRQVHLRDFKIFYSDWHTVIFSRCEKVFVDNVSIINNFFHTNSDGIDPESCKDVFISNCYIIAGDDCICPKTEKGLPLDNLVVQNCILESVAAAFKLGTGTSGDFRDVKVSNCAIRNSGVGLGIFMKDGGTVERVSFSNISIETTPQSTQINSRLRNNIIPIYIDIEQRDAKSRIGRVRDVSFADIQIASDNGVLLEGMKEQAIENLVLRNITFRANDAFDFSQRKKRAGGRSNPKDDRITKFIRQPTWFSLAHIDGLVLDNLRVFVDPATAGKFDRSAIALFESENATLKNIQLLPPSHQPVIALNDCRQVLVTDCLLPPKTPAFVGVSGKDTSGISLTGNALSETTRPFANSKEVPQGAVKTLTP